MSVLIVTSVGDIVVDLYTDRCPLTTKNFLKLCKMKYYNGCLFHKVEKDFLAQTGDPTGTGTGGDSVYKFLYGDQARLFEDEIHPDLKHTRTGTVAMASAGENCNASQFYFTLRDDLDYLDEKHTVFGIVEEKEGLDTLQKINESYVDDNGRPFKDIRIKHAYILDDPFDDPPQLAELIPDASPEGKPRDEVAEERLEDNWVPLEETLGPAEMEELIHSKEAHTNAAILESIGDIPDADIAPPDNVLFVCKLNPVTQDEDLYTIFSRFGTVTSAEIIRDYKTGDSLCYAFIEFEKKEDCERAYFKMDNTLIDDRRIHVDFSQSVAKLWGQYRHGKKTGGKKDGCYKCGATDHFARDCDEEKDKSRDGLKYVMKDDNVHRGGGDHHRYEMVFDEDNADESERRMKKRKADSPKNHHSTKESRDKKVLERESRHRYDREEDRKRESSNWRHHGDGHRSETKYEDREYERHHKSSRERDYRREKEERDKYKRDESDRYREKRSRDYDDKSYRERRRDRDDRR